MRRGKCGGAASGGGKRRTELTPRRSPDTGSQQVSSVTTNKGDLTPAVLLLFVVLRKVAPRGNSLCCVFRVLGGGQCWEHKRRRPSYFADGLKRRKLKPLVECCFLDVTGRGRGSRWNGSATLQTILGLWSDPGESVSTCGLLVIRNMTAILCSKVNKSLVSRFNPPHVRARPSNPKGVSFVGLSSFGYRK